MKKVLLVIDIPADLGSNPLISDIWNKFLLELSSITKKNKGIETLAKNVLLIPINTGLSQFVQICSMSEFSYRCLFLEQDTVWVSAKN